MCSGSLGADVDHVTDNRCRYTILSELSDDTSNLVEHDALLIPFLELVRVSLRFPAFVYGFTHIGAEVKQRNAIGRFVSQGCSPLKRYLLLPYKYCLDAR